MMIKVSRSEPTFLTFVLGMLVVSAFFPMTTLAQTPPNDICDNALDFSDNIMASGTSDEIIQYGGSTIEATDDDPNLCGDTSASKRGVWYLYQNNSIPEDSTVVVTVSTCTDVTDFDTALTLYQGFCNSLQCINGVDNDPECGLGSEDIHSTISWHAETGTRYYILVHGSKLNHTGTFGISLDHQAPLPKADNVEGSQESGVETLQHGSFLWVAGVVIWSILL